MTKKSSIFSFIAPIMCVIGICMIAACGDDQDPVPTAFDCTTCPIHSTCDSANRTCNCDSGYVAFSDSANGINFACNQESSFNCSTCPAHSTCDVVNQVCNCDLGYESVVNPVTEDTVCQEEREKLLGGYQGESTCLPGVSIVPITLSPLGSDPQAFKISGLATTGGAIGDVQATVSGTIITIPNQTTSPEGYNVSGSGTFTAPDSIAIHYVVAGAGGTLNCDYTGGK